MLLSHVLDDNHDLVTPSEARLPRRVVLGHDRFADRRQAPLADPRLRFGLGLSCLGPGEVTTEPRTAARWAPTDAIDTAALFGRGRLSAERPDGIVKLTSYPSSDCCAVTGAVIGILWQQALLAATGAVIDMRSEAWLLPKM